MNKHWINIVAFLSACLCGTLLALVMIIMLEAQAMKKELASLNMEQSNIKQANIREADKVIEDIINLLDETAEILDKLIESQ